MYVFEIWEKERELVYKYEVILGNCNGAFYTYEIFRYFHQRSWVPNPIFNSMPRHMLYTLGTKEIIKNMDLGKDYFF